MLSNQGKNSILYYGLTIFLTFTLEAQTPSAIVYTEGQCLSYLSDLEGNRIPDFSQVGYRLGHQPIPRVGVTRTIQPVDGDNTQSIQAALDEISLLPLDSNQIRGCLLLSAGTFSISGTLVLAADGIVLRGTRDPVEDTLQTILLGKGNIPNQRNLIVVGGNSGTSWSRSIVNSRMRITNSFLPAGSRTLQLESLTPFAIGSRIIIIHPGTQAWLESIRFGDTEGDQGWEPGEIDILYNRRITGLFPDQNKIGLDVPIYDHFDASLAQAEIYLWNDQGIVRNSGVEDLRIDIETGGPLTEDHVWTAVYLEGVEDCWVRKIEARHFGYAGVNMTKATRVTVDSCKALEPHSLIEGSRRYNFAVNHHSNNILFSHCTASFARHAFISNGASSASGIVFYDCHSLNDLNASEGHRRWSQGLLFDNVIFSSPQTQSVLGLYNRGSYGTGHGWGTVHSVAWNVAVVPSGKIIIQKPPGRQNYAIGCRGNVTGSGPFSQPTGYIESVGDIAPVSLFMSQVGQWKQSGPSLDGPARLAPDTSEVDRFGLQWLDIAADESGYLVQASVDGVVFEDFMNLPANTSGAAWPLDSLADSRYFRVLATGVNCSSPFSNVVERPILTAVSEGRINVPEVFPNPALGVIQWSSKVPVTRLQIMDTSGQIWFESSDVSSNGVLSLADLSAGVYILRILDVNHQLWTKKLIKL